MVRDDLILDRYEPIGTAGTGGFATVQIAWDPRIQRKVAIKTIKLTALDAQRAALPGAQAVAGSNTAHRWHGAMPWQEYLAGQDGSAPDAAASAMRGQSAAEGQLAQGDACAEGSDAEEREPTSEADEAFETAYRVPDQVTSLAHLPGLDEARTAAMLSDPRIVTVYDFEVRGRFAYLIMEYVEGITLTRLLADYPDHITIDMVAAVFDSVAGALTAAHDAGVLHLDIKPDNILISPAGQVKVTDFGLATLADASGEGTTGGGTIGYMPLEQMRREHLDARADEWALASVTYEMLTGSNPFRARGLDEAESAIENAELILPSLCWDDVDEQIDDVVFYALDPDRDERYESVSDFAEEMDKFLGDPHNGVEQLALVVADALALDESPEGYDEEDDEYADWPEDDELDRLRPAFFNRVAGVAAAFRRGVGAVREVAAEGVEEGRESADHWRADDSAGQYGESASLLRRPLLERIPERVLRFIMRGISGACGGFVAYLALSNMSFLAAGFGPGTPYVVGAIAVVVAILSALWADVGALLAFFLFSVSVILCGHPVVGTVMLIATVVWWYVFAHDCKECASVALLVAPFGAIGAACAVPFVAGGVLKPVHAAVTMAFGVILAFALGCMGTCSLLGWDAFSHWAFLRADVAGNALAMAKSINTWTTAVGWIAAASVLSVLHGRSSRPITVIGIAIALACVLVGSLAFSSPTPQLIVPAIFAAVALLICAS